MIVGNNITKRFFIRSLFKRFNFTIPNLGLTAISGESGIGKTTLLNIIANRIHYSGRVVIDERFSSSKQLADNKVFFITGNDFFENLSIEDNINFYLNFRSSKLDYYLKKYDLFERKQDLVSSLSKGEKNRLCFIIALLRKEKYILFDEIDSGLDKENLRLIFDDINKARLEKSIVIATHNQDIVSISDKVIYPNKNEVIGDIESKKTRFKNKRYIESYIYPKIKKNYIPLIINLLLLVFLFLACSSFYNEPLSVELLQNEIQINSNDYSGELDPISKYIAVKDNPELTLYYNGYGISINNEDIEDVFIRVNRYSSNEIGDGEVNVSSTLYDKICELLNNAGIINPKINEISINGYKIKDIFSSSKSMICFSSVEYWKYYLQIDFPIDIRFNNTGVYDYLLTKDILKSKLNGILNFNNSLIISGEKTLIINDSYVKSDLISLMYEEQQIKCFPFVDDVNIINGTKPVLDHEILLPSFLNEIYSIGDLCGMYKITGFYNADMIFYDRFICAYSSFDFFIKNMIDDNKLIISLHNSNQYLDCLEKVRNLNIRYTDLKTIRKNNNVFFRNQSLLIFDLIASLINILNYMYLNYVSHKKYLMLSVNQGYSIKKLVLREVLWILKYIILSTLIVSTIEFSCIIPLIAAKVVTASFATFKVFIYLLLFFNSTILAGMTYIIYYLLAKNFRINKNNHYTN